MKYVLGNSKDFDVPSVFVVEAEEKAPSSGTSPSGRSLRTPRKARGRPSSEHSRPDNMPVERKTNDALSGSVEKVKAKMCILSSQLDDASQNHVAAFASTFGAGIAHNYNSQVTHLVVFSNKSRVLEQRTMKYLKAMSGTIFMRATFISNHNS